MGRAARCGPFGTTIKEDAFTRLYFSSGNGEESYRQSYSPGANRNDGWVRSEVHRLLKGEPVQRLLDSLRAEANKRSQYDLDKAMVRIAKAYDKAAELGQSAAMVAAVRLETQLQGLLIERSERTNKTLKELTDEQLDEAIKQTATEAGFVIERAKENSKP